MAAHGRPLHTRLAVTAGYAAAALLIVAATPILRRHPVQAAAAKAHHHAATARSGIELWLDGLVAPPLSMTDLLLESALHTLASRPQGATATG